MFFFFFFQFLSFVRIMVLSLKKDIGQNVKQFRKNFVKNHFVLQQLIFLWQKKISTFYIRSLQSLRVVSVETGWKPPEWEFRQQESSVIWRCQLSLRSSRYLKIFFPSRSDPSPSTSTKMTQLWKFAWVIVTQLLIVYSFECIHFLWRSFIGVYTF